MSSEQAQASEESGVIDETPEERQLTPTQVIDEVVDSMWITLEFTKRLKVDAGMRSLLMARAPHDYYKWTLE
jgi:hypothetical protein